MDKISKLKAIINQTKNIVVMTGAGISVPSGIPDFRSSKGLYQTLFHGKFEPEEILSHQFFFKYPDLFYEYYFEKLTFPNVLPNVAHYTLARLEAMGIISAIITQNIDGLHQKAGSKKVIELHGSIHHNSCVNCQNQFDLEYILKIKDVPYCKCGGIIKPDVVLYGEPLNQSNIEEAILYIKQAEVLIIVGTSLMVQPASSLIYYFRGQHLIIINQSSTPFDSSADLIIHKPLETVLNESLLFK